MVTAALVLPVPDLRVMHKRTTPPRAARSVLPYTIRVSGFDRPGIVPSVTQVLAHFEVNVRSLESRLACAPHSGTPLFVLEADLDVPSELALGKLRRELAATCEEENLLSVPEWFDHCALHNGHTGA